MSGASHVIARPERIWPSVKVLLEQHGLSAAQIKGTGNRGQLLKGDVLEFLKHPRTSSAAAAPSRAAPIVTQIPNWQPPPAAQPFKTAGRFVDLPNAALRQQLANRVAFSKSQVPHAYLSAQFSAERFRKAAADMNVSRQGALAKLVASAIRQFPALNAHFLASNDSVRLLTTIDLELLSGFDYRVPTPISTSVKPANAVAPKAKVAGKQKAANEATSKKAAETYRTERRHARVLLRNADRRSVNEIQSEIDATIAKPNQPDNATGSFTLICYVEDDATVSAQRPVIGVPQVACLGVSLLRRVALSETKSPASVTTHAILNATLSFDARAVDEITATDFLAALKHKVEFMI